MSEKKTTGTGYKNLESPVSFRYFNTAGPIRKEKHYNIDPLSRIDYRAIISLIHEEKYFVLHAPRQSGKTSYLITLMDYINHEGEYKCFYTNFENAQASRENVKEAIEAILWTLADDAKDYLDDSFLLQNWREILAKSSPYTALQAVLKAFSKASDKPVVLFIDEIDSLVGDTLISVLRQLRSGYPKRPALFPQSIILCGVRDVRDYPIYSDSEKTVITGGSAFNIKAESLRLGNFTLEEIEMLYNEHTKETGQVFEDNIFSLVWDLTEGQPWLVNALAYEMCFKMEEGKNREKSITMEMVNRAKENIILKRQTHIHQLSDKLKEERVQRVIEPILSGDPEPENIPEDDIDYAVDLGLIHRKPHLRIANRIYGEIIPRKLTYSTQRTISEETSWYVDKDGRLNMDKLLTSFQDFFRKHFEHWLEGFQYAEAGPQLFLQAFLQRIINGGGQVEREYGLGRERTDLLVIWPYKDGIQQVVLELKIRRDSLEKTIEKAMEQTWGYMDKCGTREGYLLIFDRSPKTSWKKKIFRKEGTFNGEKIKIFGM